jgi:hypothetical protein
MYKLRKPAVYPLTLYQDCDFSVSLVFGFDIADKTFKAQIRKNAQSSVIAAEFTIDQYDNDKRIDLSLSRDLISDLPTGNYVWDLIETYNLTERKPIFMVSSVIIMATATHDDNNDN